MVHVHIGSIASAQVSSTGYTNTVSHHVQVGIYVVGRHKVLEDIGPGEEQPNK